MKSLSALGDFLPTQNILAETLLSAPKTSFFQSRRTFLKHALTIAHWHVDRAALNLQKACLH